MEKHHIGYIYIQRPDQLKIIATQPQECSELSSAEVQVKTLSTTLRFVQESSSQQRKTANFLSTALT